MTNSQQTKDEDYSQSMPNEEFRAKVSKSLEVERKCLEGRIEEALNARGVAINHYMGKPQDIVTALSERVTQLQSALDQLSKPVFPEARKKSNL